MNLTTALLLIVGFYLIVGIGLGIRAARISPLTRTLPKSTVILGFLMYAVFWIPMQIAVRKEQKNKE